MMSLIERSTNSPKSLSQPKNSLPELSETVTRTKPSIPEGIEISKEIELPPNELYITMTPPQNVAILHIYESKNDKYSVWGGHVDKGLPTTKPENKPSLSLARQVENKLDHGLIKSRMKSLSKENVQLRKWLKDLMSKVKNLCLVIADHTDLEIPWEMLELSPEESPRQYVGALITTVRWRKVISINDDYPILEFKTDECCGQAVAYLLEELGGLEAEIEILKQLQGTIYQSSIHSIKNFHIHLQRRDTDCGFVYMSCHGFLENNPEEMALGSKSNKQERLTLQTLGDRPPNLIQKSQGIVFLNACHSAHDQVDPVTRSSYRKGFVEFFLGQGARGVIGTLAAVDSTVATNFARGLIEESLNSSDLSVAEILKKLRFKAVENLGDEPTLEQLKFFINTFMYVYYGSPMTVLRLTRQRE
ncbi:MAG: CHAT domain-containing protein [Nostoc sp. GBBB01]|nr:CHAT domain-containing protein [Nostoc sp. GBBB01]